MAERGVRFLKIPKLLNIILRRFDFDYFTFQRIKVNDRV
jgi:ubiquitin carboxyl-terminal hydrolase 47